MDFCQLKKEGDVKVYERICEYCESITRLREPEIKHKIDRLQVAVNRDFSEDFIFTDIHNEKDNLYIYKLNPPDHNLLGLVGILPYLLKRTTKLCYLVTKLHLEKEWTPGSEQLQNITDGSHDLVNLRKHILVTDY